MTGVPVVVRLRRPEEMVTVDPAGLLNPGVLVDA